MKSFLLGFVVALALIAIGGFAYLALGFAPVATSSSPLPFERFLAHLAMHARISRDPLAQPTIQPSEPVYLAGAEIYKTNCAVCHGLPGAEPTGIAKGEFPPPPDLFHGKGVSDDPPGITYWKVANGIRLTGMPGFNGSLTSTQMWQVSLMLANSDKLPEDVVGALKAGHGQ
jgi:mono/diheme cytochrome c family protein